MTKAIGMALAVLLMLAGGHAQAQEAETQVQTADEYSQETLRRFQNAPVETPTMPKPIRQLAARGAQTRYLGFYEGMHGWMTIQQGQPAFYYTTPNGNALVRGFMFDAEGEMITGEQITQLKMREGPQMMALSDISRDNGQDNAAQGGPVNEAGVPALDPVAAPENQGQTTQELFLQSIQTANSVLVGEAGKPSLYAFIDPDCEHCRAFLRAVKPYIDQGFVSLQVIPVGFETTARQRAAYLLAAGNPGQRLFDYIAGDDNALQPLSRIDEAGMMHNIKVMGTWNLDATPIIIYSDMNGNAKVVRGIPEDMQALVSDVIKG